MIHFKHAFGLSLLTALSLIGIGFSSWYIATDEGEGAPAGTQIKGYAIQADEIIANRVSDYGITFNGSNAASYCFNYYTYTSGSTISHHFTEASLSLKLLMNRNTISSLLSSATKLTVGVHYYADENSDIFQFFQSTDNPSKAIMSLDVADSYQIGLDVTYRKQNNSLFDYFLDTSVFLKQDGEQSIYDLIQNDALTSDSSKIPVTITFPFNNVDGNALYEILTTTGEYAFNSEWTKLDYTLGISTK